MTRDEYFDSLDVDEPIVGSPLGPFQLHPEPVFDWVDEETEHTVYQYEKGILISVTKETRPSRTCKQVGVVWTMR